MTVSGDPKHSNQVNTVLTDPTVLTTEALHREVAAINDKVATAFRANESTMNLRFSEITAQFAVIERHRVEQKQDTKTAVDAALAAQKESATKSEADVNRKLDQIMQNVQEPISNLKERVTRIESTGVGGAQAKAGMIAMIGAGGIVIGTIINAVFNLLK